MIANAIIPTNSSVEFQFLKNHKMCHSLGTSAIKFVLQPVSLIKLAVENMAISDS